MNTINAAAALVCGCVAGLLLLGGYPGGLDAMPGVLLMFLGCLSVLWGRYWRHDRRVLWAGLLFGLALIGCGRTLISHSPPGASDLSYYNITDRGGARPGIAPSVGQQSASGAAYFITGVVSSEPSLRDKSQTLRISSESLRQGDKGPALQVKGDLVAILPRYPEYSFGERLVLEGALTAPPVLGDFDYAGWLARQGVNSYMTFPHVASLGRSDEGGLVGAVLSARTQARNALKKQVGEPEASLAVGVVVGDRSTLPDEIKDAFRRTGTTHILAISGQNITALIGCIWLAWRGRKDKRVMPWWLLLAVIGLLVYYTAFTGASPSVVRAAVMGSILLCAPLVGRRYDATAALALAGAGMVALDPDVIADAGFQLSFLAMWGLVTFAPSLTARLTKWRIPSVFAYPLAVGVSAQVATLPLIAVLGGQVSLVSLFATMTADLSLVYLMLFGIFTAIFGMLSFVLFDFIAWLLGMATWMCAGWLLWWVEWWAALPWAAVSVEGIEAGYAIAYYAALFAAVWLISEGKRRAGKAGLGPNLPGLPGLRLTILGATAACVWAIAIYIALTR